MKFEKCLMQLFKIKNIAPSTA